MWDRDKAMAWTVRSIVIFLMASLVAIPNLIVWKYF